MQIKKGKDRVVIVLPSIGLAIKFPIICLRLAAERLWKDIKSGSWEQFKWHCQWPMKYLGGYRGLLFRGLAANWIEFSFYRKTRHQFLQPTYFSFFGLFNIQRLAESCNIKNKDLWDPLHKLTNREIEWDAHHFFNPKNFCFHKGKLRMLDYGSGDSHGIITRYGAQMAEVREEDFLR